MVPASLNSARLETWNNAIVQRMLQVGALLPTTFLCWPPVLLLGPHTWSLRWPSKHQKRNFSCWYRAFAKLNGFDHIWQSWVCALHSVLQSTNDDSVSFIWTETVRVSSNIEYIEISWQFVRESVNRKLVLCGEEPIRHFNKSTDQVCISWTMQMLVHLINSATGLGWGRLLTCHLTCSTVAGPCMYRVFVHLIK